jgi:hypothetical protein
VFLAIEANLDVRYGSRDGAACAEFSWEGFDDGSPASGRGWAALGTAGRLVGHIFIHRGDDSGFVGERQASIATDEEMKTRGMAVARGEQPSQRTSRGAGSSLLNSSPNFCRAAIANCSVSSRRRRREYRDAATLFTDFWDDRGVPNQEFSIVRKSRLESYSTSHGQRPENCFG